MKFRSSKVRLAVWRASALRLSRFEYKHDDVLRFRIQTCSTFTKPILPTKSISIQFSKSDLFSEAINGPKVMCRIRSIYRVLVSRTSDSTVESEAKGCRVSFIIPYTIRLHRVTFIVTEIYCRNSMVDVFVPKASAHPVVCLSDVHFNQQSALIHWYMYISQRGDTCLLFCSFAQSPILNFHQEKKNITHITPVKKNSKTP